MPDDRPSIMLAGFDDNAPMTVSSIIDLFITMKEASPELAVLILTFLKVSGGNPDVIVSLAQFRYIAAETHKEYARDLRSQRAGGN